MIILLQLGRSVLETTLSDKVCQWLETGQQFSTGTPVSSINTTDCHYITEILLKVALNAKIKTLLQLGWYQFISDFYPSVSST
jgi:hypothetical protein